MNDNRHNQDEALLIDFLMGHNDSEQAKTIADRLERDPAFAELHANLASTFAAMELDPAPQLPEGLVSRTMAHIDSQTQLDSLLTQQATGHDKHWWESGRKLATAAAITVLLFAAVLPWFVQKAPTGPTGDTTEAGMVTPRYNPDNPSWDAPAQQEGPVRIIILVPNVADPKSDAKLLPIDAMHSDAPASDSPND